MTKRSLASLLALGALAAVTHAQDIPGYGDLGVVETTTHTRDQVHRVFPVDLERLDGNLRELEAILQEAFGLWEGIVTQSERTLYENPTNSAKPSVVLHFWDDERYDAARQTGTDFAAKMHEAQRKAKRISAFFDENAANRPELYVRLLERHAKVLELFTIHNTLLDWGTSRNLTYDTALPFDQKDVWILEPAQYEHMVFPVLPRIIQTTGVATTGRTAGNMSGMAVERDSTVVTTTRITFLQALAPETVFPWIQGAEADIEAATAAQAAVRAKADSEDQSNELSRNQRIRVGSQADFDAAKAKALEFARAMTGLKAKRNAALSLLSGSDLLMAHEDLAADWESIEDQFETLANWGEEKYIQWDGLGVSERNQTFFHQQKFPERHIFEADEPALEEPQVTTGTGGITAEQVMNALRSRTSTQRKALAEQMIPRIGSLSLDQLNQIADLMSDSYEDDVLRFGLEYVNR